MLVDLPAMYDIVVDPEEEVVYLGGHRGGYRGGYSRRGNRGGRGGGLPRAGLAAGQSMEVDDAEVKVDDEEGWTDTTMNMKDEKEVR